MGTNPEISRRQLLEVGIGIGVGAVVGLVVAICDRLDSSTSSMIPEFPQEGTPRKFYPKIENPNQPQLKLDKPRSQ